MPVALETIDYQYKDSFPNEVEKLVSSIYSDIEKKTYEDTVKLVGKSSAIKSLEKLFMSRLGLNVKFSPYLDIVAPAAIIPFFGDYFRNVNEPDGFVFGMNLKKAIDEFENIHKERGKMLKAIHNRKGFVNTKLAKVGGYLSDVRHTLIIDFFSLRSHRLSAGEVTAIILHELGHAFNGLEDHNKLETTNRAILDVLNDIYDKKVEHVDYVFKNKATQKEFENASMSDSKVQMDFCSEVANEYLGVVNTQLMNGKYDETNFENMADSFATRFGRGRDLITGLDKIHRATGQVLPNSKGLYLAILTIEALLFAGCFLTVPVLGAVVFAIYMVGFFTAGSDTMTYDFPIERYNRVRNTLINGMKRLDLPKDVLKDLLEQYDVVSDLMEKGMAMKPSTEVLARLLRPSVRNQAYHIDLQQKIENSLNNHLFVNTARLRAI